jgi:hypothetical protein
VFEFYRHLLVKRGAFERSMSIAFLPKFLYTAPSTLQVSIDLYIVIHP